MASTTGISICEEMNRTRFIEIMEQGKDLNVQLWADIKGLDTLMRNRGNINGESTYQFDPAKVLEHALVKWTPYDTTESIGNGYGTIDEALQTLCRGPSRPQQEFVDAPARYSIRIDAIQDQQFRSRVAPWDNLPATGARTEAVYNLIDGYAVFTYINMPVVPAAQRERAPVCILASELFYQIWNRLHEDTQKRNMTDARTGQRIIGPWMSATSGMTQTRLHGMTNFINYLFFQVPQTEEVMNVIKHCLFHNNVWGSTFPLWKDRVTFRVGHWSFYALLGTSIGQVVVELLARRKATKAFGHKAVKSITLFTGNETEDLTDDDRRRYATDPIILFEIVALEKQVAAQQLSMEKEFCEAQWRYMEPDGNRKVQFLSIKQPQVGTSEGNLHMHRALRTDASAFA